VRSGSSASWKPLHSDAPGGDNRLVGVVAGPQLVGREAELAALERFIASLASGPAAFLICGSAGIGKTSIWRAAASQAENAGVRVLRSRCVEVEMPIAFGALSDLLEGALNEVVESLSGAQRRALVSAFGRGEDEEREDWLVLAAAVLAVVRALAGRGPLLLAVDDVQWLDPGSRRVLTWALRRPGDTPIGVLATLRDETRARDPFALSDVLPPERFSRLDLGPLSAGALQHLIAARTGLHLPRPTLTRVQRASGGNPLFALEFARGVAGGGEAQRPTPLEVPASLEELIRARVETLPTRLRPLLEVASALERPTLRLLEQALGDVATESLVEAALRGDVLLADQDGRVRFTHPLLAAAVYFGIAPRRRRALHGRLAGLVE
jgi:predicted ATPase